MKILCLGDSLTYGFGVSRAQCWTALTATLTSHTLVNKSVNGNTTGGMLAGFYREVAACQPGAVFLMGGCNDLLYSGVATSAKANMGALAHLCCGMGLLPLIGIPPAPCPPIREDWAAFANLDAVADLWPDYTQWLRSLCRTFGFLPVDFHQEYPRKMVALGYSPADCTLDGLHPNAVGHRLFAKVAAEALSTVHAGK